MNKDGEKKVIDPSSVQPTEAPRSDDQLPPAGDAEPGQHETEDDQPGFGILPQRDLKKNLGCG